jgi:hypothetical protein
MTKKHFVAMAKEIAQMPNQGRRIDSGNRILQSSRHGQSKI